MRGIPDNSVGGILGAFSIRYSRFPELAVASMDRVLIPGGLVKFSVGIKDVEQYEQALLARGFEVVRDEYPDESWISNKKENFVLTARKKSKTSQKIALQDILVQDKAQLPPLFE